MRVISDTCYMVHTVYVTLSPAFIYLGICTTNATLCARLGRSQPPPAPAPSTLEPCPSRSHSLRLHGTRTPHNPPKTRTASLRHGAGRSWLDQADRPSHSSTARDNPSERPPSPSFPTVYCMHDGRHVPLLRLLQTVYLRRGLGSHMPLQALFHRGPLAGVQVALARDRTVPFSWELWGLG